MTTPAIIHFDGGARSTNSGPADIGYNVEMDDFTKEGSERLGKATNYEAEYYTISEQLL